MADDAVMLTAFSNAGLIAEWGLELAAAPTRRPGRRARPAVLVAEGPRQRGRRDRSRQPRDARRRGARRTRQVRRGPGRPLLTDVDRDHEAAGLRAAPRRPRTRRAGSAAADGGELRSARLPRRRAIVPGEATAELPTPRRADDQAAGGHAVGDQGNLCSRQWSAGTGPGSHEPMLAMEPRVDARRRIVMPCGTITTRTGAEHERGGRGDASAGGVERPRTRPPRHALREHLHARLRPGLRRHRAG